MNRNTCLAACVWLLSCCASLYAQYKPELISARVLQYVNALRDSHGLQPVEADVKLNSAAKRHSQWMVQHQKLTHFEEAGRRYAPSGRVLAEGGTHDGIAENCLYLTPPKSFIGQTYFPPVEADYDALARDIYLGWRFSPGHYANMIRPDNRFMGLGYASSPAQGRLYATQVFAAARWEPPADVMIDPFNFGIREGTPGEQNRFLSNANMQSLINGIHVENDSIFCDYWTLGRFQDLLGGARDGIALDLVLREQFPEEGPNQLHGSPLHDGVLLAPRYGAQLKPNKQDRIFLGIVPEPLRDRQYSFSILYIQGGTGVSYHWPLCVQANVIPPRPLWQAPLPVEGEAAGYQGDTTLLGRYLFAQNDTVLDSVQLQDIREFTQLFPAADTQIRHIRITAWASVEGGMEKNGYLHQARARAVEAAMHAACGGQWVAEMDSRENWEAFFEDVRYTQYAWLADLDTNGVRAALKRKPWLADSLEPILAQHRYASVEAQVSYTGPFAHLPFFLQRRLLNQVLKDKNYYEALREQYTILQTHPEEYAFHGHPGWGGQQQLGPYAADSLAKVFKMNYFIGTGNYWHSFRRSAFLDADQIARDLWAYPQVKLAWLDAACIYQTYGGRGVLPGETEKLMRTLLPGLSPAQADSLRFSQHAGAARYFFNLADSAGYMQHLRPLRAVLEPETVTPEDRKRLMYKYHFYNRTDWATMLTRADYAQYEQDWELAMLWFENALIADIDWEDPEMKARLYRIFSISPVQFYHWVESSFQLLRIPYIQELHHQVRVSFSDL